MSQNSLDIMSASWEKKNEHGLKRNRVIRERREQIKKGKIEKAIKKYILIGGLGLALGGSVGKNLTNFVSDVKENYLIEQNYTPYKDLAREIVEDNTVMAKNASGEYQPQYQHSKIAKAIENYEAQNGQLKGDALLSAILEYSIDNAYNNDDRIVSSLSDDFTTETNKTDYIHSLGYETEEDYLKGIKDELYRTKEKEEIKDKYFGDGGLKR